MVEHYPALERPADPVCSVCIANYNGATLLGDCLASVFTQEGGISVEVIVHDDASTDDSIALLRAKYPQVEVLASRENVGFCIGNNRMVERARGEFVLLLNNDAALYPDALLTLLSAARAQILGGILTLPQYDWTTGVLIDRGCLLDPFYNPVPNLDPKRTNVAMAIGACLWIPRALWNELGGFPVWMKSIAEDMYVCCVARSRGFAVRSTTTSGFRHRLGTSFGGARIEGKSLSSTFRRRRLSERNKTFALVIFTPTAVVWVLLPIHLLILLIEGTAVSVMRWNFAIFRDIYFNAFTELIQGRKAICQLRHQAQSARRISAMTYFEPFSLLPRKLILLLRFGVPKITR